MGYRIMNAEGRHLTTVAVVNRVVEHYVPEGGYIEEEGTGKVTFRHGPAVPAPAEPETVVDAPKAAEAPKAKTAPRKRKKK